MKTLEEIQISLIQSACKTLCLQNISLDEDLNLIEKLDSLDKIDIILETAADLKIEIGNNFGGEKTLREISEKIHKQINTNE